jgi:hypothetical protein
VGATAVIRLGIAVTERGIARKTHVESVFTVATGILSHKAKLVFWVLYLRNGLITKMKQVRRAFFITGAVEQSWKGKQRLSLDLLRLLGMVKQI